MWNALDLILMVLHYVIYLYLICCRPSWFATMNAQPSCRADEIKLPPPFTDPSNYPKIVYRLIQDDDSPTPVTLDAYDFSKLKQFPINVANTVEVYTPVLAIRFQQMYQLN